MTQAIAEHYALAQTFVESGDWRVDLEQGHVIGKRGVPLRRRNSWGYVQIKFRSPEDWRQEIAVLAHRVIWESANGPSLVGHEINHLNGIKADNRLVNLELVTHSENVAHALRTGLTRVLVGTAHPAARLAEEDVRTIYRRAWAGEDQGSIAADFGVGRSVVSNIKRGWAWSHITKAQPGGWNAR